MIAKSRQIITATDTLMIISAALILSAMLTIMAVLANNRRRFTCDAAPHTLIRRTHLWAVLDLPVSHDHFAHLRHGILFQSLLARTWRLYRIPCVV